MDQHDAIAAAIEAIRRTGYRDTDWIGAYLKSRLDRAGFNRTLLQKMSGRPAYPAKMPERIARAVKDDKLTDPGAMAAHLRRIVPARFAGNVKIAFEQSGLAAHGLPLRTLPATTNQRILADSLTRFIHEPDNFQQHLTDTGGDEAAGVYRIYRRRHSARGDVVERRLLILRPDPTAHTIHALEISRPSGELVIRPGVFIPSKLQSLVLLSGNGEILPDLYDGLGDEALAGAIRGAARASGTGSRPVSNPGCYLMSRSDSGFEASYMEGRDAGSAVASIVTGAIQGELDQLGPIADLNSPAISDDDRNRIRSLSVTPSGGEN